MIEVHPFGSFVPPKSQYLFLGTFTGKVVDPTYDWFFGTKRSQFWPILESVYNMELSTKIIKQKLFSKLHMAITDLILQCERSNNTNADNNLINIVFNTDVITKILSENQIKTIFFSSRKAEQLFNKHFNELKLKYPGTNLVTLPSPSPRYALLSKPEKIKLYQKLLPPLTK
jgi:hypoxanthine-DNA glycosylase